MNFFSAKKIRGLPFIHSNVHFGKGTHSSKYLFEEIRKIKIYDARNKSHRFKLDVDGFELLKSPFLNKYDKSTLYNNIDQLFDQCEKIIREYYPDSTSVFAFDHIIRNSSNKNKNFEKNVLATPHGDYTERSGKMRAMQLLCPYLSDEKTNKLLESRFAIVNIWLPLKDVQSNPLAMCTWNSVCPKDVLTQKLIFPHRTAETYQFKYSPKHQWIYFSNMTSNELLLIKTFDSQKDVSRFCIHSSIKTPADSLNSRISVEIRVIVFWGDESSKITNFVPPHLIDNAMCINEENKLLYSETLPPSLDW